MIYPLKDWLTLKRGYKFGQPTFYSSFHLGTDVICPTGTMVFAPCDGVITNFIGTEGGITIHLKTPTHLIRFLHLSRILKTGAVKEGEVIALSGNTGSVTTAPHLHTDISKGALDLYNTKNFIDPEIFYKPMNTFKLALINLDVTDPLLATLPAEIVKEVGILSGGKFPIEIKIINYPRSDALLNLDITAQPTAGGLTRPYLKECIDKSGVTGYQTTGVLFHWDGINPSLNIRPRAHGAYNETQMIECFMSHSIEIKPQGTSPMPGWKWSIIHELCHSIFFRLNDLGLHIADTTHDDPETDFSDEFRLFNNYLPQLIPGVVPQPTPVPEPMIDFRTSDSNDPKKNIYVYNEDTKLWHPFAEPKVFAPFAKFGKVTVMPQKELDALPKGMAIALALVD